MNVKYTGYCSLFINWEIVRLNGRNFRNDGILVKRKAAPGEAAFYYSLIASKQVYGF